ncbi:MAG: fibronectin type III domain-containing protein [Armatimonadota bacterium]
MWISSLAAEAVRRGASRLLCGGLLIAAPLAAAGSAAQTSGAAGAPAPRPSLETPPVAFERNRGQTDPEARFVARGSGHTLYLTPREAVLQLRAGPPRREAPSAAPRPFSKVETATLRFSLAGGARSPRLTGVEPLPGTVRYVRRGEAAPITAETFAGVQYEEVYPGIDLHYYAAARQVEYDFVVAPGADPRRIQWRIEGARSASLERGDLLLRTAAGTLRHTRPVAYQEIAGAPRPIRCDYTLTSSRPGETRVSFRVGEYDRSRPLVIDPVVIFATPFGGTGQDTVNGVAVDRTGASYLTGQTASLDFPTRNPIQAEKSGVFGLFDAFVTKINPTGTSLVYSTYFGGTSDDSGQKIEVDAAGAAYVVGTTTSNDFPVTPRVADRSYNGLEDVFVLKLDPTGTDVEYSTYLGGSRSDVGLGIAVDANGLAHVVGSTESLNFPIGGRSFDRSQNGLSDAFLVRLSADGRTVDLGTFLGGDGFDVARGVALDADGAIYLAGGTDSLNFPTTSGAFDRTRGGIRDAFAAKLSRGGGSLVYSTFVGGSANDEAYDVAVTPAGVACLTGETRSLDFPTTSGGFDRTGNFPTRDAFVACLARNGASLTYGTYLGGVGDDVGTGIDLDPAGRLYVAGFTASVDFPLREPVDVENGGLYDAFAASFAPGATGTASLLYSTYFGGSADDAAFDVAVDENGSAYLAGETFSFDFPRVEPLQSALRGVRDGFLVKLAILPGLSAPRDLTATAVSATEVELNWVDQSAGESGFEIERRTETTGFTRIATTAANVERFRDTGLTPGVRYTYRVRAVGLRATSAYSNEASVETASGPPSAPDQLQAEAVSSTSISLTWRDTSANESGFRIERKTGNGSFTQVATVDANVTSYLDTGLSPGTRYTYRVRAVNAAGSSAFSNEASATTSSAPPPAPDRLAARALSSRRVELTWRDRSTNEESFEVERRLENGTFQRVAVLPPNTTRYEDQGLEPETVYFYRVRAVNAGGPSAYTDEVRVETLSPPPPPAAPEGLAAAPQGFFQINLQWLDRSTNEEQFEIERRTAGGAFARVATVPANTTTFADTMLQPGTLYFYRVRAVNEGGESAYSNVAQASTAPLPPPPAAPAGLDCEVPSTSQVRLTWQDRSNNEERFVIQRRTGTGAFQQVGQVAANTTSFTDSGLEPNTRYFYRVAAENAGGTSAFSEVCEALTLPAAATNLTGAAQGPDRIALIWVDNNPGNVAYRVERSEDGGATFRVVGETAPGAVTFEDTGLQEGTTYRYRVQAVNASGTSGYSNIVSIATLPPAGGSLRVATRVNFGRVRVGRSKTVRLLVRNVSRSESLSISTELEEGPFSVLDGGTATIPPNGRHRITLVFRPQTRGRQQRTLLLRSSDPSRAETAVRLRGNGVRR